MSTRQIYGIPTITISEGVEQFMALQGNNKRGHFLRYLIGAKWAWKDLLWNSIYAVKHMNVKVDTDTNTFRLPGDMNRLIDISVVDDNGRIQPLTYDEGMNTLKLQCPQKTCSCTSCNGSGDTLCDAIGAITLRTESIIINGVAYEKRIYNKNEKNGDVYEVSECPYYEDNEIKYVTNTRWICSLEVDTNGCPKATEPNKTLFKKHCGCFIPSIHRELCRSLPNNNNYGYYKEEDNHRDIIHLRDTKAEYVTVAYQSSGDGDHIGMMIPEFAASAFFAGMEHYISIYSPVKTLNEKEFTSSSALSVR